MNRFRQLWDYGVKVFGLYEFLKGYQDSRVNPKYRPAAIISLFMGSIPIFSTLAHSGSEF